MSCSTTTDGYHQVELFNLNDTQTVELLEALYSFKLFYGKFHKYISFLLCTAGILANICHICVLTRAHMRKSSVHTTLTCIAIADIGTMTSYLIYITRYEFMSQPSGYAYYWAEFLRVHAVVSIALHAVSLYLVVFMAFIRLMALDIGQSKWRMPKLACIICIAISILIFIICLPTFFAHEIYERDLTADLFDNTTNITGIVENYLIQPKKYNVGFSKALPCFLLFWFTLALLRRLRANEKKRRERFFRNAVERTISNTTIAAGATPIHTPGNRRMADRTTYVLLLMLSVFLLTELPQGLFAMLNGKKHSSFFLILALYTYQFHSYVYMSIADVLDLLSLINCYVAFTIYMLTSSSYRNTLFVMLIWLLPKRVQYNKLTIRQNIKPQEKTGLMKCIVTYGPPITKLNLK